MPVLLRLVNWSERWHPRLFDHSSLIIYSYIPSTTVGDLCPTLTRPRVACRFGVTNGSITGNNFYKGRQIDSALLALIEVIRWLVADVKLYVWPSSSMLGHMSTHVRVIMYVAGPCMLHRCPPHHAARALCVPHMYYPASESCTASTTHVPLPASRHPTHRSRSVRRSPGRVTSLTTPPASFPKTMTMAMTSRVQVPRMQVLTAKGRDGTRVGPIKSGATKMVTSGALVRGRVAGSLTGPRVIRVTAGGTRGTSGATTQTSLTAVTRSPTSKIM